MERPLYEVDRFHSYWLSILFKLGIIGVVLVIGALVGIARRLWQLVGRDPGAVYLAVLYLFLVAGNVTGLYASGTQFGAVIGIALAIIWTQTAQSYSESRRLTDVRSLGDSR